MSINESPEIPSPNPLDKDEPTQLNIPFFPDKVVEGDDLPSFPESENNTVIGSQCTSAAAWPDSNVPVFEDQYIHTGGTTSSRPNVATQQFKFSTRSGKSGDVETENHAPSDSTGSKDSKDFHHAAGFCVLPELWQSKLRLDPFKIVRKLETNDIRQNSKGEAVFTAQNNTPSSQDKCGELSEEPPVKQDAISNEKDSCIPSIGQIQSLELSGLQIETISTDDGATLPKSICHDENILVDSTCDLFTSRHMNCGVQVINEKHDVTTLSTSDAWKMHLNACVCGVVISGEGELRVMDGEKESCTQLISGSVFFIPPLISHMFCAKSAALVLFVANSPPIVHQNQRQHELTSHLLYMHAGNSDTTQV